MPRRTRSVPLAPKSGLMKAVLPLFLIGLLGLGATGASAQTAPGDPAGNQTIPEKDLSRPDASRRGGSSEAPERPPSS